MRDGRKQYHIIEIMACPGGCIDGGGQPYMHGNTGILTKRMNAIYNIDSQKHIRQSHKNPEVLQLYNEYLGELHLDRESALQNAPCPWPRHALNDGRGRLKFPPHRRGRGQLT